MRRAGMSRHASSVGMPTTPKYGRALQGGSLMPTLRDLLRQSREQRGLSQEDLAAPREPPLSPDTISNLERGRTRPHRQTLEALCHALRLDADARQGVWAAWRTAGSGKGPVSLGRPTVRSGTVPAQPTPLIGREWELQAL
jgi:ribosome-binding protein aMBF1 (putative translation factor)